MLTARSQGQDVERATTAGVTDYIVKPFDLVEVLEKIKRELSRAGK
jgi:DNA-binding response OmpR family regulator